MLSFKEFVEGRNMADVPAPNNNIPSLSRRPPSAMLNYLSRKAAEPKGSIDTDKFHPGTPPPAPQPRTPETPFDYDATEAGKKNNKSKKS